MVDAEMGESAEENVAVLMVDAERGESAEEKTARERAGVVGRREEKHAARSRSGSMIV